MWWDEVLVFERQPLSCVTKFTKWTRNVGQFLRGSDRNHCDLCLLGWEMYARTATGTGQIYRVKELKQSSFNISVGSDGWNTEPLLFDTLQLNRWKEEKKTPNIFINIFRFDCWFPPVDPCFKYRTFVNCQRDVKINRLNEQIAFICLTLRWCVGTVSVGLPSRHIYIESIHNVSNQSHINGHHTHTHQWLWCVSLHHNSISSQWYDDFPKMDIYCTASPRWLMLLWLFVIDITIKYVHIRLRPAMLRNL